MPNASTPILIVDDEEIVLLAIAESLIPEGYRIVRTTSPFEALEILKRDRFAVIISDHHMPGMTGLEFFAQAQQIQPNASRILITGVLTLKVVVDAINKGEIFRFIAKPWIREELLATVKNAIHRYELVSKNALLEEQTRQTNSSLAKTCEDLTARNAELTRKLAGLEATFGNADEHLERALDLSIRILHNLSPGLGREAATIVRVCQSMAATGRIPEKDAFHLRIAAYLTTMGKIGIEESQLRRFIESPQVLKADDLEVYHNLPVYAQLYASGFQDFEEVGLVIRASHERWDGQGFPDGLMGQQIPLAARYLAVAVAYAESPQSREASLESIRERMGSAFWPDAVSLFFEANPRLSLPPKTKEVRLEEMIPGQVLAEDISYPSGAMLMPKGTAMSRQAIMILQKTRTLDLPKRTILIHA
ncbi:MAG: response regulator [Opitutales bacterium]|nr:response regulator [Opitutales bacterium]